MFTLGYSPSGKFEVFYKEVGQESPSDNKIRLIKSVERSAAAPDDADNAADISKSGLPTYVWYENNCMYWYSEAPVVYLNADCSIMFGELTACESIDLTGMDTSQVTDMEGMFEDTSVRTLDLSGFDTSHVTNMSLMFNGNYDLESLDLSGFDMSSMPATDPDNINESPVYRMIGYRADSAGYVTWWPGVTDAEKKAARVDTDQGEYHPDSETTKEETTESAPADSSEADSTSEVQNADGTYQITADGRYYLGQIPLQDMSGMDASNYITSYDLQEDAFTFTTNSIFLLEGQDDEREPAGTYVVPVSANCKFVIYGDEDAGIPDTYDTIDEFRSDLARYGGLGLIATIENGEIVEIGTSV